MPSISFIPNRYYDGFKAILTTDEETFTKIVESLSLTPLVATIKYLSNKVSGLMALPSDTVEKIFLSAGSLRPFLDQGNTIEEVVQNIIEIVVKDSIFDLTSDKEKGTFSRRLSVLLKSESLYYASKANELLTDNGCIFIQGRVITDIRPIFGVSVEESPKAGIFFHNLHIHYHSGESSEHKDIYFALDSSDIKALKELLIRAEKKEESLRPLFKKTGMINLNE